MMNRIIMLLLLVALALPALGCYHNQVIMAPDYDPSVDIADEEDLRLHLFGLFPLQQDVNLQEVCANGAGVVESRVLFRIGIVDFSQTRTYCK